jgi:hypothetical protein
MSLIPGSIPITGFIAPTDSTDTYAVTDALYGIDGLRNVQSYSDRNTIPIERRRSGMIVGIIEDNTYWKLKNQTWSIGSSDDWEPFILGNSEGFIQYFIDEDETVIIGTNSQYWVYGDLTLKGIVENNGQVIIANGSLIIDGGTFSNFGTLAFVSFDVATEYIDSDSIKFEVDTVLGDSIVSAKVKHSGLTSSHLKSENVSNPGQVLSTNSIGDFKWIDLGDIGNGINGTVNKIALFVGTYSIGDSLVYQSTNLIGIDGDLKIDGGGHIIFTNTSNNNNTIKIKSPIINDSYDLTLPLQQGTTGSYLTNDGNGNLHWTNITNLNSGIMTYSDKNLIAIATDGDFQFTGVTISQTPVDNCYVSLFINGQEFPVGNGVTNSIAYFSGDGGLNAKGFSQNHPNGKIQIGDELYWNGTLTGLNLQNGWRISLHYMV